MPSSDSRPAARSEPELNLPPNTHQLWFSAAHQVEVRQEPLARPAHDQVLVQSECSAISAGTEMLLYRGQMPSDISVDANFEAMQGAAHYPMRYGYACVGKVIAAGKDVDAAVLGRRVFAFEAHASHFCARPDELITVPEDISAEAAVFLPNMETAINLVHDARPALGERAVVLGQGVVGLLVSGLLAEFPLQQLIALDGYAVRRKCALDFRVDLALDPCDKKSIHMLQQRLAQSDCETGTQTGGADLIFELSGNPAALNTAIELSGYTSRIVIGSWYGSKSAAIELGGAAHRNRLQFITSQVSTIAPDLSGRWSKQRRFASAWQMIRTLRPQRLITHRSPLEDAPALYHRLHSAAEDILQAVLTYSNSDN